MKVKAIYPDGSTQFHDLTEQTIANVLLESCGGGYNEHEVMKSMEMSHQFYEHIPVRLGVNGNGALIQLIEDVTRH